MSLITALRTKCAAMRPKKFPAGRNEAYPREEKLRWSVCELGNGERMNIVGRQFIYFAVV